MKNLLFVFIFFVISCSNITEPTEVIIVDQKGIELNWIRFRSDRAWYLPEYKELFSNIVFEKYECSKIELFETDLLFFYEIDGKKSVCEISSIYRDTTWVWCEKK